MQTLTSPSLAPSRSLAGKRVALARGANESDTPAASLAAMGAEIVHYPCLEMMPPDNLADLDYSLQRLVAGEFDWLVLTTASTVIALAERLAVLKIPVRKLQPVRVAAYGATTRKAASDLLNVAASRFPETATHSDLVRAMQLAPGSRVLLPIPAGLRPDWPGLLAATGAQVTTIEAYRAMMCSGGDEVPALLWSGEIDAIAFTSETNVRYFAKRLQYEGGTLAMLDDVCVACIEPQTAAAARSFGLHVDVVPRLHTAEGLAAALSDHFARD